jgi:lipopolysaccharide cholinephosphotransferase
MNNYILIIIIIIIIIILLIKQLIIQTNERQTNERQSNDNKIIDTIINYVYDTENERNIAMNGLDLKYYINFAFHYRLLNLFEIIAKKFDENNINYFLICGGLIGYHRHNKGFIPWDDDIDIGVMEQDKDKIYQAMDEIVKENENIMFRIVGEFVNHGMDKIIYRNSEKNAIVIDLFYFQYIPENNYYHYHTKTGRKMWPNEYIYEDEIFPLQTVSFILYDIYGKIFKEINIKIPYQSKKYLDRAYKNWETMKKPTHSHIEYFKLFLNIQTN